MVKQAHVEALFDCLDESATIYYKEYSMTYLEGVVKTCENIMSNSVEKIYSSNLEELEEAINKIAEIEFNKEEIRKAFQYACLRGFKHANLSNEMITPDTIGIFVNYLIKKLYTKKNLNILDPLVGTGNLITTIANGLSGEHKIMGVDIDVNSYKLANALFDMLDYGEGIFCQDVNTFTVFPVDLIISDFSGLEEEKVYEIIKTQSVNILPGGFMIGIFDDKVIGDKTLVNRAKELNELWKLFGMVKLPIKMFKNKSKSIVVFQRNGEEFIQPKNFLMVELPDFDDVNEFTKVISQLNNWFKNTDFYKIGE